jgi:hypothetical protein
MPPDGRKAMLPCEMARYIAGFWGEARQTGGLPAHEQPFCHRSPSAGAATIGYARRRRKRYLDLDGNGHWPDDPPLHFEILSEIADIETIAARNGIREIARLRKMFGPGFWRKRKGISQIRLPDGNIHLAEIHWYEASGIGRRDYKIKQLL